jgi:hypothetical protein
MPDPIVVEPVSGEQDFNKMMEAISNLGGEFTSFKDELDARLINVENQTKPTEPVYDPNLDPENKPPESWKALREEFRTAAEIKAEEKIQKQIENQVREEADKETQIKSLDQQFDNLADEAVKAGFLPAVVNASDHNDAGNAARRELFGLAAKQGTVDLMGVAEVLKSLHDDGKHFDVQSGKIIRSEYRAAGKSVPVGSSAARVASGNLPLTAKELHSTSIDMLLRRAKAKYDIE